MIYEMLCHDIIQSIYEDLGVNLKQIGTQSLSAVSGTEKCALQHTKSPKESLLGKCRNSNNFIRKNLCYANISNYVSAVNSSCILICSSCLFLVLRYYKGL